LEQVINANYSCPAKIIVADQQAVVRGVIASVPG
jgi:hypothetical protein